MSDPISILILLISGIVCIFTYFKLQEKRKRIIENGIEVSGVVFEYDRISVNNDEPIPVIRFVTKDGLWITERSNYAISILKEGQKVKVIYNSKNPKEFIYMTRFDWSQLYYLVLLFGAGAILVGLWFAYKYLMS